MVKLVASEEISLPPVWPNQGVESWYRRTLDYYIEGMHLDVSQALENDWTEGYNPVGLIAQDAPSLVTLLRKSLDKFAARWIGKFESMSERIANDFVTRNRKATDAQMLATFRKAGFTIKFRPTATMRAAYQVRVVENVNLIKSIPEQYLKNVTSTVYANLSAGSDMHTLQKALEKNYNSTRERAALIARDQNNKAKAQFEQARRLEVGIEEAEWVHSAAGKEEYKRPTHVKAGAERARFKVAEGWLDPHDNKRKLPGHDINCRCTSRAIIPGLTRKKRR